MFDCVFVLLGLFVSYECDDSCNYYLHPYLFYIFFGKETYNEYFE